MTSRRKNKVYWKSFIVILLAVTILRAAAQPPVLPGTGRDVFGTADQKNDIPVGSIPAVVDNNAPPVADTTSRPPRIRKPLESYFFGDSLRARSSFVWNVSLRQNEVYESQIDTILNGFQVDNPLLKNSVGAAYLGNMGAAGIQLDYFERPIYRHFTFAETFDGYNLDPERVRFFNVKRPLTELSYIFGGQARRLEENLIATHAQNISPSTGFNVDYYSRGTRGMYLYQRARQKNLSFAFSHTGKKYSLHAGYVYNSSNLRENGGVFNDTYVTDSLYEYPDLIQVNLTDAQNTIKNNRFYIVQSYGIPLRKLSEEDFSIADRSSVFFGHSFEYSRYYKKYTDTKTGSGDFYEDWFINSTTTKDSIFEAKISNRFFLQIQPWDRDGVIGTINAGVGNDLLRFYQFHLEDYVQGRGQNVKESVTFVYGSMEGKVRKYASWNAQVEYHPFGFFSQDFSVGGNIALSAFIRNHPVTLTGSLSHERRTPDFWAENFFSNHFTWQNSFAKENETRFSLTLSAPAYGLELGARQSVVTNKIYYDALKLPAQEGGTVSVSSLYAKKDLRAGGFHFDHWVLLQMSSDQKVIPVPLTSVFLSYYYEFHVVKDVLRVRLGLDGRYNTSYYAFGYNPATTTFYNQREKELGNYPLVDGYVSAKWKRMRILVKMQHLNENLFRDRNYFTVLHYPLNRRMIKFGFSWSFYD